MLHIYQNLNLDQAQVASTTCPPWVQQKRHLSTVQYRRGDHTIISTVVSAASEAEVAALYLNGQAALPTRQTLSDLGYHQSATPIFTDNTTALGIANSTVRLISG